MARTLVVFIKWFLVFAILGLIGGGFLGVFFSEDFESARRLGQIAGAFIWPLVLVASIVATMRSRARERKREAADRARVRVSDLYVSDGNSTV